jgi:hypothetical protein
MPLPAFRDDGWLPAGHHLTTWDEIVSVFGADPGTSRARTLEDLLRWRDDARAAGLTGQILLNGSFISAKPDPGDFDLIFLYDTKTKDLIEQDPSARQLTSYTACKTLFGGDVFIFWEENVRRFPAFCDITMFDRTKMTGVPKGVVEVLL